MCATHLPLLPHTIPTPIISYYIIIIIIRPWRMYHPHTCAGRRHGFTCVAVGPVSPIIAHRLSLCACERVCLVRGGRTGGRNGRRWLTGNCCEQIMHSRYAWPAKIIIVRGEYCVLFIAYVYRVHALGTTCGRWK